MVRCRDSAVITFVLTILVALACLSPASAAADKLSVSVIDVGQGDSILVQFPNGKDMLVDAADSSHGQTIVNSEEGYVTTDTEDVNLS